MDERLDVLDRATMTTWRVSNYTLWGAVAVLAAIVFHQVVDQFMSGAIFPTWAHVGSIDVRPTNNGFTTFWGLAPRYAVYAGTSIIGGLLIAIIVTRKVRGRVVAAASVTALAYVAISWLILQKAFGVVRIASGGGGTLITREDLRRGLPSGAHEWSYAAVGLLAVVVAWGTAVLVQRRRTKKLSRGTLG